jgi:hypothetical protein
LGGETGVVSDMTSVYVTWDTLGLGRWSRYWVAAVVFVVVVIAVSALWYTLSVSIDVYDALSASRDGHEHSYVYTARCRI